MAAIPPPHFNTVWNTVRQAVERLDDDTSIMLGYVRKPEGYKYSLTNARYPGTFEAVRFFAETHLNLPPVIGAD